MSKSSVEVWLWLLLVMQPYNPKTAFILSNCDYDAAKACEQIRDGKLLFLSENEKRRAKEVRMGAVRQVQNLCAENRVRIITFDDGEYPERLRNIENPPIVLFVAGDLNGLDERLVISAVGARNVSDYGKTVAEKICGSLAKIGTIIVSGLAVGSDSVAHKACLNAGGKTVGVLGCGILVNYPAENAMLKREIVDSGGAVISELLPTTKTFGGYFPQRNRIISGLSHGTLVLEAGERSGSLLTANHALEQGREVFCIPPHDIFSARYSGVVPLLRAGAIAAFSYTDILDAFAPSICAKLVQTPRGAGVSVEYKEPKASAENHSEEPKEEPVVEQKREHTLDEERLASLEPNEAEILKALFESPADADRLVDVAGLDFSEVSEILTNLELMGYISRNQDGSYSVT